MHEPKKGTFIKKAIWVLVGLAAVAVALTVLNATGTNTNATNEVPPASTKQYRFELAKDLSRLGDELSASSVNRERLLQRFQQSGVTVDASALETAISSVMDQNPDIIFGISIRDLSSDITYNYGNADAMTAASVTKVLTAVYYFHQVELGNRSLNTVMSNGVTAEYNIEQMIVVSDNNAWHILNENLGYPQLQEYARMVGLESYSYTNNKISSSDTAQLFADLYVRKLINETNTQSLLSYMERANYRDLIIPAVPSHDTVYHKAGEYLVNLNDAAIVTNGTNTIVLSIYTESTAGYSKTRVSKLMQEITTHTLELFGLD